MKVIFPTDGSTGEAAKEFFDFMLPKNLIKWWMSAI